MPLRAYAVQVDGFAQFEDESLVVAALIARGLAQGAIMGEDGEEGPMGPPGLTGAAGAAGANGAAGAAGSVGAPGIDGDDGDDWYGVPVQQVTALQGFPGGTSTFLRADGSFAAPTAAAADLDLPETGALTVATAKYHITGVRHSATTSQRITVAGTGRWRIQN